MTTLLRAPAGPSAEASAARSRRLPGLDGLRALAVAAVIAYHLFPAAAPGGFIGVDVFFVISGFLITHLLLAEHERHGRIRLGRFWSRRARRLLPALTAVVLVCGSAAALLGGDVLVGFARQVAGAATFSSNWLAIIDGESYFAADTPDLFRNFWSLALEEQFYLVWPLLLLLLLLVRRPRVRAVAMGALALASAVTMALAFHPGLDASRAYYGTDTHSFGLALGTVLALVVHAGGTAGAAAAGTRGARMRRALARIRPAAGVVGLAVLAAAVLLLHDDAALTYRGGLLVVSLVALVVVWSATAEGSRLGRGLDVAPLRVIGERSYGIYLWHWPVFLLVGAAVGAGDPARAGGRGLLIAAVTIAATLAAAELSYRHLEQPIRRRGLRRAVRAAWTALTSPRSSPRTAAVLAVAVLCVVGTAAGMLTAPHATQAQVLIDAGRRALQRQPAPAAGPGRLAADGHAPHGHGPGGRAPQRQAGPAAPPPATAAPADPGAAASAPAADAVLPWEAPRGADGRRPLPSGDRITAVGDSVMLASAPELTAAFPEIAIDAKVSRQMSTAPGILSRLAREGRLRPVVVVGLGTNGAIAGSTLDDVLRIAGNDRRIVLVDVQAPRDWTPGVNRALDRFAAAHPRRVQVAHWREAIAGHLDLLAPDHIHPGSAGGKIYVAAVRDALRRLVDAPAPGWYLLSPAGRGAAEG